MRFSVLSAFCLLGGVIASPIELAPQDTSVIDASMRRVASALTALNTGMRNRKPGGDSYEAQSETNRLILLTQDVLQELWYGERDIKRGPNVNPVETVILIQSVNNLTSMVKVAADGWIDSKRMVVAGGKKGEVLELLLNASQAAGNYCDAIITRLPGFDQPLAVSWKIPLVSLIERAISEYRR